MKKRFIALLLGLAMVVALAACGSSTPATTAAPAQTPSTGDITVIAVVALMVVACGAVVVSKKRTH